MGVVPHVSYVFDKGFQYPTLISAFSLCKATRGKIDVSLFVPEANTELVAAVEKLNDHFEKATVEVVVSKQFSFTNITTTRHQSSAAYGRLLLNRFLDRKTIYLDGDTLIMHDIGDLYSTNMQGKPIAGCRDTGTLRHNNRASRKLFPKLHPTHKHIYEQPHNFDVSSYINTGVLVIDFDRIKDLNLGRVFDIEQAVHAANDNNWYFPDQDWINHALRGNIHLLPQEWNSTWGHPKVFFPNASYSDMTAYSRARTDPAIIHFTGKNKPWKSAKKMLRPQKQKMHNLYARFQRSADTVLKVSSN